MIGQRISMTQTRRIKDRLAAMAGDPVAVEAGGEQRTFRPFPRPQAVAELADLPGLAAVKVERLRGLARAALDGRLDTERLRGARRRRGPRRAPDAAGDRRVDGVAASSPAAAASPT